MRNKEKQVVDHAKETSITERLREVMLMAQGLNSKNVTSSEYFVSPRLMYTFPDADSIKVVSDFYGSYYGVMVYVDDIYMKEEEYPEYFSYIVQRAINDLTAECDRLKRDKNDRIEAVMNDFMYREKH